MDKQKNRTMNWLNGLGLQLPVPNNLSSSNNIILPTQKNVNSNNSMDNKVWHMFDKPTNIERHFIETIEGFSKTRYNNATDISEQINYKERGILRHIIADDSNVRPGLNRIYTTNAEYLVYLEDKSHYKILSRKVDSDAGKLTERNTYTGRVQDGSSISGRSIDNTTTKTSNDGIFNINSSRESERVQNNRSSERNNENVKEIKNTNDFLKKQYKTKVFLA